MANDPEWFCLSFAWAGSTLSFRVGGCGKRLGDWTVYNCFWSPVVIHRFQGTQGNWVTDLKLELLGMRYGISMRRARCQGTSSFDQTRFFVNKL